MIYPGDDTDSELLDKDEGLKYEHFEQHKLISEELNLEPEEYIPKSCDKSHTVGSSGSWSRFRRRLWVSEFIH